MQLSWRQRLEQEPSLQVFREWPFIDALTVLPNKRRQFLRNQQMVAQALTDLPLKQIAARHGVVPSLLTHLLNRALGGDEAESPALTRALVPGERLTLARRRKVLGTLQQPSGSRCSFSHLLTVVPGLKDYLDKLLQLSHRRTRTGQNLRVDNFHKAFLRYLRQSHWPQDTYPFTHISQGYESLRKYFHEAQDKLSLPKEPHRVIIPRIKPVTVFEEIQIDEHTVDCHGAVVLVLNDKWEPLRLSRITLIAARDVASGAVLGATLVLNGSPNKDDLLALFAVFTRPWKPLELTAPGFSYPAGAAMPTALGTSFLRPAYGIIRLDNAMMHRALAVRDYVCDRLGATFNLGIPKYPLARVLIEGAFKNLNLTIHRFPSTTGSYPTDPVKEPAHHAKKPPVISLKVLEEAIHLHMAHLNRKPLGNLGAVDPIQMMREQMANHWIPLRPACAMEDLDPMTGSCWLPVHYSARERRRPWVNFESLRYDAPGVLTPAMSRQKIRVEFDRSDARDLKAFNAAGEYLGILKAPATWQRFCHSLSTRKMIIRLIKQAHISADDPLGSYFDFLLKRRGLPIEALELVRVSREFGGYPTPEPPAAAAPSATPKRKPVSGDPSPNIPDWSPRMVDNRRKE